MVLFSIVNIVSAPRIRVGVDTVLNHPQLTWWGLLVAVDSTLVCPRVRVGGTFVVTLCGVFLRGSEVIASVVADRAKGCDWEPILSGLRVAIGGQS